MPDLPIACSLEADDLRRRLEEIAALGAECLQARDAEGEAHLLRFRSDPVTLRRLGAIVDAESACCPFLELRLSQEGDELILRIAAPGDGARVANDLALAFGEPR
jgi:hypothetical protein